MKKILRLVAWVVTLVAILGVSTASWWYLYQPKAPKCLEK